MAPDAKAVVREIAPLAGAPKLAREIDPNQDGLQEPFDLSIDPTERFKDGTIAVTYRFQLSAMEPEKLIIAVSEICPRLCFVLGTVDPASNEASSLLAYKGKASQRRLPTRRIDAIYPTHFRRHFRR